MKNIEQKIGFDSIREQIALLCSTAAGRDKFAREQLSTSERVILSRLDLAHEMRTVLMMENQFPSGDYYDLEPIIAKTKVVGAWLTTEELADLRKGLECINSLLRFFASKQEHEYIALKALLVSVSPMDQVVAKIDRIIDRFGEVKDNASPELSEIRRSMAQCERNMAKHLQKVLEVAKSSGIVDAETTLSIRDGRAVIPVSAANKRKIKGFLQGESATGKTVFIEPLEVVETNNRLKELEGEQKREIVRILTVFTQELREDIDNVELGGDALTTIDMVRAKGRWAVDNGAVKPILSKDGRLYLKDARHPLLAQTLSKESKIVVPLTMSLDRKDHILVISGPNAGGKSVCLKSVGLLQYMFQCGVLVTTSEISEFPIFNSIFIDIGDEQSIDNDLSTYSSHLLNMKQMLTKATDRSLILIDEFGTGTEPIIGGAIAESVLEKLTERGVYGVITTHYANLKHFATVTKGIVNGAMMFDVQRIEPLFRLEMGSAGSSFAIEIAKKIGLSEEIIALATSKAGQEHIDIEKQLREISRDRHYWEQKRERIKLTDKKLAQMESSYAKQLEGIKEQRNEILKKAREEAKSITQQANKLIENTVREIKESQAEKSKTILVRKKVEEFKESLDDSVDEKRIEEQMERLKARQERRSERKGEVKEREEQPTPEKREVETGAKVRINGGDVVGEVISIKGKRVQVTFGQVMTTVDISRLEVVSNAEFKKRVKQNPINRVNVDISERKLNFKPSIDVRGMRAVEALEIVEDFVDNAIMIGVSDLKILHGKGTGALKEEIRRYLKSISAVASFEEEHVDRGGAGITLVKLR